MEKPNFRLWIVLGVAIVIAAIGYPFFFDWWDHRSCFESGGTWNEEQGKCLEPRGADIPNTEKSLHSQLDDPPRE